MAKKQTAGSGAAAAKPKATRAPGLKKQGFIMKVGTGYYVKPTVTGRKRTKAASKSHVGKPRSAATKKKISIALKRVWKTGKTQSGRKTLLAKKGKKPGISKAAVTDKGRKKHKAALVANRGARKVALAAAFLSLAATRAANKPKGKGTGKKPPIKR